MTTTALPTSPPRPQVRRRPRAPRARLVGIALRTPYWVLTGALALILCVTGTLLAFDHFYILTKGGPDNTTVTIVQLVYQQAFVRQNLGNAAALSLVLLAGLLILNLIWFRLLRRGATAAGGTR